MRFAALVAILCPNLVVAQAWDLNLTGAGARAEGLGQAFTGIADDATALVWNPGGLTTLQKPELSIVGKSVFSENRNFAKPTFASIVYPMQSGLVIAAAYQEQINFTFDFEDYQDEDGNTESWSSTGGAKTITVGVAHRVGSVFSIGLAANYWFDGADWDFTGTDLQDNSVDDSFREKSKGVNGVVGILADLGLKKNPLPLKLGLVVRTPGAKALDADEDPFKIPLMTGLGASYRIGEAWTVAADGEARFFENAMDDGRNTVQLRVGTEYLFIGESVVIPVRLGFRTNPSPFTGEGTGKVLAVGSGYIASRFAFDMAYAFVENPWTGIDFHTLHSSLIVYF